jgi:hypothetical protein
MTKNIYHTVNIKEPPMKRILSTVLILCSSLIFVANIFSAPRYTIGYLKTSPESKEEKSAIEWLKGAKPFSAVILEAGKSRAAIQGIDILWIHCADSISLQSILNQKDLLKEIKSYYDNGGKILCTDFAAMLPYTLGIEPLKPEVRVDTIQNDWLFDKRGFHGFLGHPIFSGFFGGEYVWDPNEDQILPFTGYFDKTFPQKGKVIGIDKAYVFVYADRKMIIEHAGKK